MIVIDIVSFDRAEREISKSMFTLRDKMSYGASRIIHAERANPNDRYASIIRLSIRIRKVKNSI